MKKKILALVIIALTLLSVFAFSSCGKEETTNCPYADCDGTLMEITTLICSGTCENSKECKGCATSVYLYCEKNLTHRYDICINEKCQKPIEIGSEFCPSCGAGQTECKTCKNGEIDGTYCPECGEQILRDGEMKFKLDFDALGKSAMILCKGMLGIFIVTGVIVTFILVLNTIVEKVNQSRENKK